MQKKKQKLNEKNHKYSSQVKKKNHSQDTNKLHFDV